MADTKITGLTADGTPAATDLVVTVDDPSGSPVNKKVTIQDAVEAPTDVSAAGWVLDEDNMTTDSATKVPTQQSVKAYADSTGILSKSHTFKSRDAASGEHFLSGFYEYATTDANLTQASLTQVYGTANIAYGAHAFVCAAAAGVTDGSDLVITVSGTSLTTTGVRTTSDTEVLVADCTAASTNEYFETTKFWIGQITLTLSSTAGATFNFDFNYGFAKHDEMGQNNFTVNTFGVDGLANANDSSFNIELLHHKFTGWTYAASGFVAGTTAIASWTTDHSTETELANGQHFAWERTALALSVAGGGADSEGVLVRVTTGSNNSITYMDVHIGATLT